MKAIDPDAPGGCNSPVRAARGAWRAALLAGLMGGALPLIGGCSHLTLSDVVPHGAFRDGPDAVKTPANAKSALALLTGERTVRRLGTDTDAAPWPNLGTVPDRPKDVPDPLVRQNDIDALLADRARADDLQRQMLAVANSPDQVKVQRASSSDSLTAKSSTPAASGGDPAAGPVPSVPAGPPSITIADPQ